jgi:cytochrome o ubiquinol oxidase subunit 1
MMLIGGIIIAIGVALQVAQILASFIEKKRLRDVTGDPWDGSSLEWATQSPPQFYNFATIPTVTSRDAFWEMKRRGLPKPTYQDIHMPKNTAVGIYISTFATLACMGFVWDIVWLIVVSGIAIIIVFIRRGFDEEPEYALTASEVQRLEEVRAKKTLSYGPVKDIDSDEDMGLVELMKIVLTFFRDVIRKKRWRIW